MDDTVAGDVQKTFDVYSGQRIVFTKKMRLTPGLGEVERFTKESCLTLPGASVE